MPRGNDAEKQVHELADEYAGDAGNAEQLIDANLARRSKALTKASLLPIDTDATAELDFSKLEGPQGEVAVGAAVRGGVTVLVVADNDGRLHKVVDGDPNDEPVPFAGLTSQQAADLRAKSKANAEKAAKAAEKAEAKS